MVGGMNFCVAYGQPAVGSMAGTVLSVEEDMVHH